MNSISIANYNDGMSKCLVYDSVCDSTVGVGTCRCTYFNLWFSELLWNFPSLGARSAQLAVLKFLAVPSELWHELNKPEPATRADPETPRPSMTVRDSASAKTPTRSPGRSLLSSRSLISGM